MFPETIIDKILETNSGFYVIIAHYVKSLTSVFLRVFASIKEIFILPGRLGTRILFYEVETLS